jgi:predicted flap endonuclease-1-like 5' DNA nuclease
MADDKTPEQIAAEAAAASAAEKTPEQLAAEAAAAAGAGPEVKAPEEPAASETSPAAPEELADPVSGELEPGQTLTALRGIPAGPADHPRLVHHRRTHTGG